MLCDNCKIIEMRVEKVECNIATHTCKKCGYTVTKEIPEEKGNVDNNNTLTT